MQLGLYVVCLSAVCGCAYGSAIPVWELLQQEEMVSYLYSIFAKEVEQVCSTDYQNRNCFKENLKHGLDKLRSLTFEELEALDPYQRDGVNKVWNILMEGSSLVKTTEKSTTSTTPKPNSYEDDLDFGSQPEETAKIDNVYRVAPPKDFVFKPSSSNVDNVYEKPIDFQLNNFDNVKIIFTDDDDSEDSEPTESPRIYQLNGPVLVKVHPDGTPVREHYRIPLDDDFTQYQLSKIKLPNL
ncbi:unnamed protein product [Brassicogethes aeneus]|uniref:Uncharacterized protein n=1 Tax=Brassicogethes aeneus TaxID=1431903 RepID=A0A9P0AUD8_BRAAE|nr:unnamed protein product [Brassicogethes aeneus]